MNQTTLPDNITMFDIDHPNHYKSITKRFPDLYGSLRNRIKNVAENLPDMEKEMLAILNALQQKHEAELEKAVREEREKFINGFYGESNSKSRNLLLKHLKNNKSEQSDKTEGEKHE